MYSNTLTIFDNAEHGLRDIDRVAGLIPRHHAHQIDNAVFGGHVDSGRFDGTMSDEFGFHLRRQP